MDRARTLTAEAAALLLELQQTPGWTPVDVEREVNGMFAGQPTSG